MNYRLTTYFLFMTTAVFAGLYFTSSEEELTVNETVFVSDQIISSPSVETSETKPQSITPSEATSPKSETKVIIKEVSSHPEYDSDKLDYMAFMYENFLKSHTARIRRSYPLLFERLSLDDASQEELTRLLSEKEMVNWMRGHNMNDDEKLELAERKEQMKEKFNQQIADLLGSETDIFQDYEDKKQQYQQISGLKGKMEESGDFSIAAQDELASLMQESRSIHKEMFGDEWKTLRESKEKADEFLAVTSERYKQLTESADFLNEAQKEVFGGYLNKVYQRFERAAKNYDRRRKSKKD